MADSTDDVYKRLNDSLYRIRSRRVTNITPLTYRDGLTFLQVLERIRDAVVETIDYANSFGEDVDQIVSAVNTTVKKFIEDVNTALAEYDAHMDTRKDAVEKLITDVNTTIEDFKSRLIRSEFTKNGDRISAPLMGGGTIDIVTYEAWETMRTTLDQTITTIRNDITQKLSDAKRETDTAVATLNTTLSTERSAREAADRLRYTKEETDILFEPRKRRAAVFIGSSNSVAGLGWTEKVCKHFGWKHYNYSIGGGAFTGAVSGSFDTQVNDAVRAMSQTEREAVSHFFVADMLNDIRANNDVKSSADIVFQKISKNYPNAQIVVLPVVLNKNSMNRSHTTQMSVTNRINEVIRAGLPYHVHIIESSPSWFYDDYLGNTDQSDGVHLTTLGYSTLADYVISEMEGNYTWRDTSNIKLQDYGQPVIDRSSGGLWFCRTRNICFIQGTFSTRSDVSADNVIFNVPTAGITYGMWNIFKGVPTSRKSDVTFYINPSGQIAPQSLSCPADSYQVYYSYKLW